MTFHYIHDEHLYGRIKADLENSYSLEALKNIKKSLKPFFTGYLPGQGVSPEALEAVRQAYSASFVPSKPGYAGLLALLFLSRENFAVYYQWLPQPIQAVWLDAIREHGISSQALILRHNIYLPGIHTEQFEMKHEIAPNLCFFSFDPYYNSTLDFIEKIRMYHFYLPPRIQSRAITLLFPADRYEIAPLDRLPEHEQLTIYENKQEILTDIPVIKGIEQQGYLQLNNKGSVNQSKVTAVTRRMEMGEFFDSVIKEVASLRGYLVLLLYTRFGLPGKFADSPEKYVRQVFSEALPNDFGWLVPALLTHVKGFRDIHKLQAPGKETFLKIVTTLRSLPAGKWVSLDNLFLHWKVHNEDLSPLPQSYLHKDYLKFRNEAILRDRYGTLITDPFIKAVVFLLGAFGIADLAYGAYSLSYDSYYESLRYLRLTGFGEYVLGKKDSFTRINAHTEKHYFEADENNLIIRSLEKGNIYEKLLLEMAVPISTTRYKVTHISFLRTCKTAADIENKIDFFRLFICSEPSEIWRSFFQSVRKRVSPLAEVKTNYKLFKLDPANIELLRLIAQDPQIKKYVLKVENHHILIKRQDINKVVERLKTYGYLL
ncbi:MAG: hypothetical protein LIP00_06040 [Parabacteroides sp.]|nr:hypothetical protein [Parabacteroides sp.]